MSFLVNPHVFAVGGGGGWSGPPGYIGNGGLADRGAGTGPLLVTYPGSLAANDIAILQVFSCSAAGTAHTISTPSGWNLVTEQSVVTLAHMRHGVFWKRLAGSESGTVHVDLSIADPAATHHWSGVMHNWRGAITTGTPYEGLDTDTAQSANLTGPAVTTTGPDRTVLHVCTNHDDTLSSPNAGGWVEHFDLISAAGTDDGSHKCYSLEQPTAGVVAAAAHTLASSERWRVTSFALIPA